MTDDAFHLMHSCCDFCSGRKISSDARAMTPRPCGSHAVTEFISQRKRLPDAFVYC